MRTYLGAGAALAVLACGGSQSAGGDGGSGAPAATSAAVAGAPKVSESYQGVINDAWAEAVAGEYPGNTCAALSGRTLRVFRGQDEAAKAEAREAMEACGVAAGSRYYLTFLDKIAQGERTCQNLIFESAKIGALLISVGEEGTPEHEGRRGRLVEAISGRVEEVCPGMSRVL